MEAKKAGGAAAATPVDAAALQAAARAEAELLAGEANTIQIPKGRGAKRGGKK